MMTLDAPEPDRYSALTLKELRAAGFQEKGPTTEILAFDPAGAGADSPGLVWVTRRTFILGDYPYEPDSSAQPIMRIRAAVAMVPDSSYAEQEARCLTWHRRMMAAQRADQVEQHAVCIETNGVGFALGDQLKRKIGKFCLPYTTVAAADKTFKGGKVLMPRGPALGLLRAHMVMHRLKASDDAIGMEDLGRQLDSFLRSEKKNGKPEAMAGEHDDLVLPLAACCWMSNRILPLRLPTDPAAGYRRRRNRTRR
jgi:hypothetical protein